MNKPKLLTVEDDEGLSSQHRRAFPTCDVIIVGGHPQAMAILEKERPAAAIVERALHPHALAEENRRLATVQGCAPIKRIITHSASMLKVCRTIERLAATNVTIPLLGESGTSRRPIFCALLESHRLANAVEPPCGSAAD